MSFLAKSGKDIEAMQQGRTFAAVILQYADVMELVDMQDLGSCAARRGGSSPFIRTT